jgi:DNA-binding HxlR family transcriptional regulator
VLKILKELGGEATSGEIRRRAKEKFPDRSLYQYVSDRLRKLEKNGYVIRIYDSEKRETIWKVKEKK